MLAFWAGLRLDRIARVHLAEIDRKIADLSALRKELARLIGTCTHGTVADCKIIETLGPPADPARRVRLALSLV